MPIHLCSYRRFLLFFMFFCYFQTYLRSWHRASCQVRLISYPKEPSWHLQILLIGTDTETNTDLLDTFTLGTLDILSFLFLLLLIMLAEKAMNLSIKGLATYLNYWAPCEPPTPIPHSPGPPCPDCAVPFHVGFVQTLYSLISPIYLPFPGGYWNFSGYC